jgi:site-specific recombinase XerD
MYETKLGLPHFAYLRAVANGIDVGACAERYLAQDKLRGVRAHRVLVDRVRAIARQHDLKDWRYIGLVIPKHSGATGETKPPPNIDDWAARNGLEDWGEDDKQRLYKEAYPPNRKLSRNNRARARQLEALEAVQTLAAVPAARGHPVEAWFERAMSRRLQAAGILILAELLARISKGGRWWTKIDGLGQARAVRIAGFLDQLFPGFAQMPTIPRWMGSSQVAIHPDRTIHAESKAEGALIDAQSDGEAIEAWITARGVSAHTARSYRREARRIYLWSVVARSKRLTEMNAEDCAAYIAFLAKLPDEWVGPKTSIADRARWTPFAGQLTAASRRQALIVVNSFFGWLVRAGYITRNPWELVSLKVGDDAQEASKLLSTRAFTPESWKAIMRVVNKVQNNDPGRARARFVFAFLEATGLRASELVSAKLSDIHYEEGVWVLLVIGKGEKARAVVLPPAAMEALDLYLAARGLPEAVMCIHDLFQRTLPVLAGVKDTSKGTTYGSLYLTVKQALRQAAGAAGLTQREWTSLLQASPHWLRHTFGTKAIEAGVMRESVQAQFGHADARSTNRYTRPHLKKRGDELARVFT